MRGKRSFPDHLPASREWKARKRRELAALQQAVNVMRMGCAYTPIRDFEALAGIVKQWRKDLSAKAWGR